MINRTHLDDHLIRWTPFENMREVGGGNLVRYGWGHIWWESCPGYLRNTKQKKKERKKDKKSLEMLHTSDEHETANE